ncbi:MAG: hypothetical protein KIT78_07570, partial [Steroidobacteraceae bacterium]|nr:hypothetical protein [Steroidobacteraceae bacterium]
MGAHKKPTRPHQDPDTESTAELPVLDDPLSSTDTWAVGALPAPQGAPASVEDEIGALRTDLAQAAEQRSALEVDLRSLSSSLRDVEERLRRKGERLASLESEFAAACSERDAAVRRAEELGAALAAANGGLDRERARADEAV